MKNSSVMSMGSKYSMLAAFLIMALMIAVILQVGAFAAADGIVHYIGEARAKSIALEHAGVSGARATFLKAHLDYDGRRVVYDVEFYSGRTEYDYEIGAVSGKVLEHDKDIEYYTIPNGTSTTTNAGQYIGEAKAKSIALVNAGVALADATFIKAYLDYDDGRIVYDVEFYSGDTEYDYEIDGVNGEILESDMEIELRQEVA